MNEQQIAERLADSIKKLHGREIRMMEVCGTHTRAISKSGIRSLLPKEVILLSGPGCPVCVTPEAYIDMAIQLLEQEAVMLVTFGDMMKVKGTSFSLVDKKALGFNIKVVYSPEDAFQLAARNTEMKIVFLPLDLKRRHLWLL